MRATFIVVAILISCRAALAEDGSRATLRGRFVYEGKVPAPRFVKVEKDPEVCAEKVPDERLLVHAKDRGIANVVVSLVVGKDEKPPEHPRLKELMEKGVEWQAKDCRFQPHIFSVLVGQKLTISSADKIGHNYRIRAEDRQNQFLGDTIPSTATLTRTFKAAEVVPAQVDCSIHAWMRGYLIITNHPYAAVTDAHGAFAIPELPPGEWTFRAWHERAGYIKEVTIGGKKEAWERGRFTVRLNAAGTDVGEVKVPAMAFAKRDE